MSFSPTITHESQALPGVRFTVHRIGIGRRIEMDQKTLGFRQRLRELEMEYPPQSPKEEELNEQLAIAQRKVNAVQSNPEIDAAARADVKALAKQLLEAAPLDVRKKRQVLDEEYATVQGQIRLVWIQAGLLSIEGGDVDGMTVEQLVEYGPVALAAEIYDALTSDGRLAGPAAKNSSSPGTSSAAEDRATSSIAVVSVSGGDGTPLETVSAGSPA